jgi:hypothetical protein
VLVSFSSGHAEVFYVNTQQAFNKAHAQAAMNDSIIWESGIYTDIYMNITKDHLFIATDKLGETVFKVN